MTSANMVAWENTHPRPDIREKVSGKAKFSADVYTDDMVFAKYVRFPYGVGRVLSANADAARGVDGVLHVEIEAGKECQYPGERIGKLVAESPEALYDAELALALRFEYDRPRTDAMRYYNGPPDLSTSDAEKLENLLAEADKVVEATYTTQVQTHSCFETHGCVIDYKEDSVKAWASTQGVTGWGDALANSAGMQPSQVSVDARYVGGGFGSKFGMGAEGNLALEMSRRFGRPCRVILDRKEEHLDAGNRPGSIQYFKIGVKENGDIVGGRIHATSIVGYTPGRGGVADQRYYKWGELIRAESDIPLNSGFPRAFRAPGHPQAAFALESMIDELAAAIGMDPVEFRAHNEVSARRRSQLRQGAELIGWNDRKPDGSGEGILRTGIGVASSTWYNNPGRCEAEATIYSNGHVEVRCGVQDIGTGTTAIVADSAAKHLGIGREHIVAKVGMSDYPPGPASGGSVVSRLTTPAVRDAVQKALEQLSEIVATEWGVPVRNVSYADGVFTAANERLEWQEACSLISGGRVSARGSFNQRYYGEGNSDCVQFAKVEVDTETGIVRVTKIVSIQAMGAAVNRLTAENQIYGGAIQGVGYALFENRRLDPHTGGMVNADLIGYKIPGAMDTPEIVAVVDVVEGDTGVRAIGEPVTVPTAAAIANAVANAIGVRMRDLPLSPDRVLAALDRKGAAT